MKKHDLKLEVLLLILIIVHLIIPVWFYLVPDIAFSAWWYWGMFLGGGGGSFVFETITFTEGTTATILIVASFILLLPTIIYTKVKNGTENKVQGIFIGIIWMISGVLLMIAPIVYLSAFGGLFERFFTSEYYFPLGLVLSFILAAALLLLGLATIFFATKK